MSRAAALNAALALAFGLAGCTGSTPDDATDGRQTAEPTASVRPSWPDLPPGVLATGEFEGGAHGSVELLNRGDGMLTVEVEDFAIDFPHYSGITALPYASFPDPGCDSRQIAWGLGYERADVVPEVYEGIVPLNAFRGDPSLIRELIIRDFDSPDGLDECTAAPAAKAVLTWSYQPLRSGLRAVDSGVTGGARGDTVIEDAEVVRYVVAPDDLLVEVAARFGMTADDVRYLNPELGPTLRAGETISMNAAQR
ncbi:LysM domain-containing protein [Agromyces protaetiae]|uniref:LysM domain-containing protein n=1 Tax=Agromyces protaetiae TaxID=2509455 RepID=A0A4P6FEK9_9MICO|nr:LysM domain-containing protein [Agromyces protaetiae]QAY74612.1 LysM domain-containing protein [Agromyces protaetiae]